MLASAVVRPTLPAVDLERAKKFYTEKLGLKLIREDPSPGAQFQAASGTSIYLYKRTATKADHTAAVFGISDFDGALKDLNSKGVKLEEYDMPNLKTRDGVATMETPQGLVKMAWFKDSEGNIISVSNMKTSSPSLYFLLVGINRPPCFTKGM